MKFIGLFYDLNGVLLTYGELLNVFNDGLMLMEGLLSFVKLFEGFF